MTCHYLQGAKAPADHRHGIDLVVLECSGLNSSPPEQNGHHFADDIYRCIFVNEKFCILIKISLKFVLKGPTDNNPALV